MIDANGRRLVYGILLTVTAGLTAARIVGVELVYEPSLPDRWPKAIGADQKPVVPTKMPTFGSNDRSRWAAIRALVENGTFVIGQRHYDLTAQDGKRVVDGKTIDDSSALNGHYDSGIAFQDGYRSVDIAKNPDTEQFYSTKPPLFTLIAAGEYWLLYNGLGLSLENPANRWPVVCTILITFNLLPLIAMLMLLANLLEEYGTTDWGRLFVFAAACFGTFLTTFAVTLNNHTPAAACALFAIYPLLRGRATNPMPFTAPQLLLSGLFAGMAACFDLTAASLLGAMILVVLWRSWLGLVWFLPAAFIPVAAFLATNYIEVGSFQPIQGRIHTDWYLYDGSHWSKALNNAKPEGIDFAREEKWIYSLHMLVGHHGLFSLTPIWLLALGGMIWKTLGPTNAFRVFSAMTLLLTLVVSAFYIVTTNNYEGWTSGPRWQFWLTPLFLLSLLPVADKLSLSAWGRGIGYLLLAVSAFSAAYPVWNPWRHPWTYVLCEFMGWIHY